MSALESERSQGGPSQNSMSHLVQLDGESFYPPFSDKLNVDEKLKLSYENFRHSIDDFFNTNLTPLSQLTATPPFPTPQVLAQFSFKTYTHYKKRETDAQYETRLALPDGWNLLTTASNDSMTNGYFGAAYWKAEHQQVVIAHRGTDPKNVGAWWTDVKGVVRNQYVRQMESASTFTHKVVEVLREVNRIKGVSFQLFFTGHSLGGWLAQVTTFTTEYLKRERNIFLKSNNDQGCCHPHTVVFDSPGCKNMLSKMTDKLDVRLNGRSVDLEHLDITSYLSAPNRINTCNKHVGTVYRIFPDLSDMDWQEKHTALYNTATHSMKKILQAFDPETGQVHEDEQGQLKVQIVIDWPISAGLKGGEEYESFFEWAKHVNNYHPDIKDEIFRLSGYHPLRYQTKIYDERVSSLRVFCQQEQQFLESYRWLRQLPEFFQPKEMFSLMEDSQAQEDAEEILQCFEIESDTIRCTDTSALQALIPYVKRLLQLFPQIKKNTKRSLSSDEVRNRVYQVETKCYVERISQNSLEFKPDALSLRDFLRSEQQQVLQLRMVSGDEWTGLIKVYQVLQKTDCLMEGQYTVLKLERLLTLNQLVDLNALMLSNGRRQLLLMACEANNLLNDENRDIFRKLFNTIKENPSIKFIFTAQSEIDTVNFLQQIGRETFGEGFLTRDECLNWRDLTASSQEKLLKKSVKFQGAEIPVNELVSAEYSVANFLPLGALLEEKKIKIADPVPISNGYNESYYIGRNFLCQKAIKQEIYSDTNVKKERVFLASTEQEFKQLCQRNPKGNVHWLERDNSEKLVWQQTQGSLETLRRYIDTKSSHTYPSDDLDKLLEQAQHQRVMLISDTAGMGKSTVLTHLSKQIKQKFPARWVVRLDLNNHTDALKALKQKLRDKKNAIVFLSETLLKLEPGLEMELFKQCCEQEQKVRIVIMLDGFDEISPSYKETVFDLLQALRQTAIEQLWVTTRPHLREELEDKLQQLSYTLEPFSEENQVEFLTTFWTVKDCFTELDSLEVKDVKNKLKIYAKKLIKKLSHSISDKNNEFTGIPLQCRMLAEAFYEEIETCCQSSEAMAEATFQLDVFKLYDRFFNKKYDIWLQEKLKTPMTNVGAAETRKLLVQGIKEDHEILALKQLFTEEQVKLLKINDRCTLSTEVLTRIGIVQESCEGKLHFIHRTFAEYCVAEFLVKELYLRTKGSGHTHSFLLQHIFLEADYAVIRKFIDGLLSRSKPSIEALRQCGYQVNHIPEVSVNIIKKAQDELNMHIIELLIISLHTGNHLETLKKLLLALDIIDLFRNKAIGDFEIEAFKEIWKTYKENLAREHLIHVMLSPKCCDYFGVTSLHSAAQTNNTEILDLIWEWAKEELSPQEIKHKLLLNTSGKGYTPWHEAVRNGNTKSSEKLWEWAKETLTPEEFKNGVLLGKTSGGKIVFHNAAQWALAEVVEILCDCAKNELTPDEFSNEFLLARDNLGRTAFYVAAEWGKKGTLEKIWECAKRELPTNELRKLLLATEKRGRTVWHDAAARNNTILLQKMWGWVREVVTAEELKNELFLAKDIFGQTALHVTAEWENAWSLEVICEWAKEELSREDLKKLLLATERYGRTAWHVAAKWKSTMSLQIIWEWAKEVLTPGELNNQMLLAKDKFAKTALNSVVKGINSFLVPYILEWAKDHLEKEEFKNILLLTKENSRSTTFHVAA